MKNKLTPKQQRFCEEYLVDLNATQAAIRAGYSKKTAYSIGEENLKKPELLKIIKDAQNKQSEKLKITANDIAEGLQSITNSDITDYLTWDGDGIKLKPSSALTEAQRKLIAEVSETSNGFRFKLYDKTKALELSGRHLGMFVDKIQVEDVTKHEFWTQLLQKVESGEITKEQAAEAMNDSK